VTIHLHVAKLCSETGQQICVSVEDMTGVCSKSGYDNFLFHIRIWQIVVVYPQVLLSELLFTFPVSCIHLIDVIVVIKVTGEIRGKLQISTSNSFPRKFHNLLYKFFFLWNFCYIICSWQIWRCISCAYVSACTNDLLHNMRRCTVICSGPVCNTTSAYIFIDLRTPSVRNYQLPVPYLWVGVAQSV
jgi:hypothetical protein